ncbi:MAG: hypothetical protein KKB51_24925 [Candidatus Riflebacteria bacterium]|nr:hypothetical protein [Candidatus Riflebacteria bacterium]
MNTNANNRKFSVIFLWFLTLFSFSTAGFAEENFAGKDYFQALEAIAKKGKIHIFVDVPNGKIASFSFVESLSPEELLTRLTKAMGHHAWEVGNSFLIITRQQYLEREGLHISFLQPKERPAESLLINYPADFPKGMVPFIIPEANLIALSGYPDELPLAQKAIENWDSPQKNLTVSLNLTTPKNPDLISSFSFLTMEGTPVTATIPCSSPEKSVFATFSVNLQDATNISMQASFATALKATELPIVVNSSINTANTNWQAFKESSPSLDLSGSWTAAILPDDFRTIASLTPVEKWSPDASTESSETPADYMDLRWVEKPLVQALQEAAGSEEQVNLVCSSFCSGTISLFGYGEDLYYEEFLNLIAKTKNLAVRKIGNTWMAAEQGSIQDGFERGLFITKRLQNTSAKGICTILKNMFSSLGMLSSVELSFDSYTNGVLVGGKGQSIDLAKRLLEMLDQALPRLTLSIEFSHGKEILRETLDVPVGKKLLREIQTPAGTATIEILPILFGKKGNIALRWNLKQTTQHGPLCFSGWTMLPKQAKPELFHFQATETISLSVYGSVSWVGESASDADGDGFDDKFDDAFDSSF